jgi:type II secretory pathway pseudopilin PulG
MLIVIVIIGILAWALIPRIGSARDKANDTARESNVRSLATAMVAYWMDHNWYPLLWKNPDPVYDWRSLVIGENHLKSFTLNLQSYGIPDWNYIGQPTQSDAYYYNVTSDGQHFVIFTLLSAWLGSHAWNCKIEVLMDMNNIDWDTLNNTESWDGFCYFQ